MLYEVITVLFFFFIGLIKTINTPIAINGRPNNGKKILKNIAVGSLPGIALVIKNAVIVQKRLKPSQNKPKTDFV